MSPDLEKQVVKYLQDAFALEAASSPTSTR